MPKSSSPPKYRHFKPRDLAVVRIDGKDHYLGPYGSKESWERYHRLLADRCAGVPTSCLVSPFEPTNFTITDILAAYWQFAERHYRKNGEPTGQLTIIRDSIRPLRQLFGTLPVEAFGCRELKTVRSHMLATGRICRTEINRRISVIRRVFRWGVSESLLPASVTHALRELLPLQRGRCNAHEAKPVFAVSDAVVEATLPYLPKVLQDVVRIQRLSGCRPGEVLQMRPADIDRSDDLWVYRPASHKTEHHGKARLIVLGPRAQGILAAYLLREPTSYCFSPAESEALRKRQLREGRKTKVQPSQESRAKAKPAKRPGDRYDRHAYGHAIDRAIKAANRGRCRDLAQKLGRAPTSDEVADIEVPHWHANQLRHAAATTIRSAAGLDVAAAVLGHAKPDTTLIYAEADLAKAAEIMRRIG